MFGNFRFQEHAIPGQGKIPVRAAALWRKCGFVTCGNPDAFLEALDAIGVLALGIDDWTLHTVAARRTSYFLYIASGYEGKS